MWIGDFVRVHSVVKLLKARWPDRPIDLITSSLCAPILDYLPGVRKGIIADLPRKRLPFGQYLELAQRLRAEHYGTVLVMPRTWKSALAPFLAGIPERTGFAGEGRFLLINDMRWGERKLERMIDCFGALALPKNAVPPKDWPLPQIVGPAGRESRHGWPVTASPEAGRSWRSPPAPSGRARPGRRSIMQNSPAGSPRDGCEIWVLGGPLERADRRRISAESAVEMVRDLTGNDLRDAILALRSADVAVTNDSGLMHIAAAIGTPTVAIFGPTSPRLWAPLNPLAAIIEPPGQFAEHQGSQHQPALTSGGCMTPSAPPCPRSLPAGTNPS